MSKTEVCISEQDTERQREGCGSSSTDIQSNANATSATLVSDTLLKIWQDLLHVPCVEPSDDFFDLGGDSLAAIRMLEHIGREFGEELLEPDIIYTASRFDDLTSAINEALAKRKLVGSEPATNESATHQPISLS